MVTFRASRAGWRRLIALPLLVTLGALSWAEDPPQTTLQATDAAETDLFGVSVCVSGDTACVGAPFGGGTGSAYVYTRRDGVWTRQQELSPNDVAADDLFGISVAVSGDTALVGAAYDDAAGVNSGSAYVFTRTDGVWTEQQELVPDEGSLNNWFGFSVSLSGDTALVGSFYGDNGGPYPGTAYVFTRNDGVWTRQQRLAPDAAERGNFGRTVSVSGDTAVVGDGGGSAYVFLRADGVWTQQQRLSASDAGAGFGVSVSLSGDTALIGAAQDDDRGARSGSAYVFTRTAGAWTERQKITAADAAANDEFGTHVCVSGDTAVIGARFDDDRGTDSGSAYVFRRVDGVWAEQRKLIADDAGARDGFGHAASVSAGTAVVGSYVYDLLSPRSGSALVVDLDPLTVVPETLETTTSATVGVPLEAAGGGPPYTWSLLSGMSPTDDGGVPASGVLVGPSVAAGDYLFDVRVDDTTGRVANGPVLVRVNPLPEITTLAMLPLVVDERPYRFPLSAAGGTGTPTWTTPSSTPYVGITVDATTGVLSGVLGANDGGGPTTTFDVAVTDARGVVATKQLDLPRAALIRFPPKRTKSPKFTILPTPPEPGSEGAVAVELVRGSLLTVTVTYPNSRPAPVAIGISTADGTVLATAEFEKATKRSLILKHVPIPETGRYFVTMRSVAELGPGGRELLAQLAIQPPKRTESSAVVSQGAPIDIPVSALPGSTLLVTAKAARGSKIRPQIVSIVDSTGAALLDEAQGDGRVARAKVTVGADGELIVRLGAASEQAGSVTWTVRIKSPKGYPFELPDLAAGLPE